MCVASAITDFYKDKWVTKPVYPDPNDNFTILPYVPTPTGYYITKEQWDEYQALKRLANQYDERTGQPHCEKPDIAEWEKVIVDVLIKRGLLAKPAQD